MVLRVTIKCGEMEDLTIPSNPYPMYPYAERLNHISLESATGERHIFDHGPTRVNASIVWKAVHYNIVKKYEDFLLNHAKMGLHPFEIICPDYMDLGNEMGGNIERAYYAGSPNLKSVISPRGGDGMYYDIELPYMFVREEAN